MTRSRLDTLFRQTRLTLATAALPALLAACGGGDATSAPGAAPPPPPPAPAPDTTAPTLAISGTSDAAVSGPVTLTFTLSESVGTSFTDSDVVVSNATAGTLTKVDDTHYTMVLTPTANSQGTITVNVAAGAVSDVAGNASTAAATASQTFNTIVAAASYAVLDFNTTGLTYATADFGGNVSALTSTGVPAGGPSGTVVQLTKTSGAQVWAGTTLSTGYLNSIGTLPFSAAATKLEAQVYAPTGTDIKIKVEDANDGTHSVETDVVTTTSGWQTLSFDMATPTTGTSALNLAWTYNKLSVFPAFGSTGDNAVYYVGPIRFVGASAASAPPLTPPVASGSFANITFDGSGTSYYSADFGGAVSALDAGPAGSNGQVIKQTKTAGAEVWAGTTVADRGSAGAPLVGPIPFTASKTSFTVRVWAPAAGLSIKLKVEDAADGTHSVESDALTTAAGWQTLTFDMAHQSSGTAALNLAWTYNKLSLFGDFGNRPGADEVFYYDDITF